MPKVLKHGTDSDALQSQRFGTVPVRVKVKVP
jgi:hypothetical protein